MATNMQPFDQLSGPLDVYIADAIEVKDDVDVTPSGNWALLGATDGDQSVDLPQSLTYFRDNRSGAPVKVVRSEEDVIITFMVVGLTLENFALLTSDDANVNTLAGPPATKNIRLFRDFDIAQYSFIFKGEALSPYGNFPAQFYIPRAVVDGSPSMAFAKDGRPGLEIEVHALYEDGQTAGDELGIFEAQTS